MRTLLTTLIVAISSISIAQITIITTKYDDSLNRNVSLSIDYPEDFAELYINDSIVNYIQYTTTESVDSIPIYSKSLKIDSVVTSPMQITYFDQEKDFVIAIPTGKERNVLGDNYLLIANRFLVFQEHISGSGLKIIKL